MKIFYTEFMVLKKTDITTLQFWTKILVRNLCDIIGVAAYRRNVIVLTAILKWLFSWYICIAHGKKFNLGILVGSIKNLLYAPSPTPWIFDCIRE